MSTAAEAVTSRFTIADIFAAREELARRKLGMAIPVLADMRQPSRYKGAWGGRGSGKSHTFAELVVRAMLLDAECSVVCIREIQKSLKLSAKKLIETKIRDWRLDHLFEIQETQIKRRNGTGICIFAGMQDHTAESIKSLEGFMIAWVEEAQSLSKRSMDLLLPTIRAPGSELWFSWNSRRRADAVEKLLRSRAGDKERAIVRKVNYTDNPMCPIELINEANDCRELNPSDYDHIWLGGYENMGSKIVIPPIWVEAAVGLADDLGIPITGKRWAALDVAGAEEGGDENGWVGRHGIQVEMLDRWNGYDTALTTQRAAKQSVEFGAGECFYDSVGVGEGVTGEWASMGRRDERPAGLTMTAWNAGAAVDNPDEHTEADIPGQVNHSPLNKDQYQNRKAQAWFHARKRFENAYKARNGRPYDPDMLISLRRDLPHLDQLMDELSQPQQKPSGTGKVMVDKQPDDTPSPNLADPVVMVFFPIVTGGYDWSASL